VQVRIMTALRHPNVVLFMAACTKPPKMCIVMEFMALGSLFDVCTSSSLPDPAPKTSLTVASLLAHGANCAAVA
jgi:serine/threonine protein kinase